MPKKITSLLTAAVLLLSLLTIFPGIALAEDGTTWDGSTYEFTQGSGTQADPYIIDTAGKLAYLAQRVNEGNSVYRSAYYSLTEDLDLNGINWVQIGNGSFVSAVFQGCFDGNGHKITGMKVDITSGSFAGLFGATDGATIKNLSVSGNVKVGISSGWAISGGIVGSAENGSRIINCCHSSDVEAHTDNSSEASRCGGIAGSNNSSEIINCYHWGNVTAYNPNGPPYTKTPKAGGVVGYIENGGTVEYCYWDSETTITPANTYGIGSATETVANVVYFSGTTPTLESEITVGGTTTDDLLTALNANLDELEDETLYKWQAGSDGYPTFDSIKWTGSTPAVSSDATLSGLSISEGTLSPAFASGTTSYTASVAHSTASVSITATVNQADASVKINGSAAASGTPTAVDLDVGDNTITIVVTAQDESTTETYTITITRAAASDAAITPLAADFDKYTEAAGYADVAVTKSDGDHTLVGIKNGTTALTENTDYAITGDTVTIKKEYLATLAAGTVVLTFDYSGGLDPVLTITVTDSTPALSSDATLSGLTISSGTLSPAFASGTTGYTANVAHSTALVNITATVNQADASVKINGSTAASGTPTAVDLNVGANTITIQVTAQDNTTTKTYTITITRAAASSSSGGGSDGNSTTYYSASVDANDDNGAVTFDKTRSTAGSKVTITVAPDEGYAIDRLSILDKEGREIDYTDNEDGTYTFTMPSGDITVHALFTAIPTLPEDPPTLPFADVQKSDWYYHSVDYVYRNQWFSGTNTEQFEPNTPMSRAMVVTVLWRLESQADINVDQVFSDVSPGEYYAQAVNWANAQEIVQGYGDGLFGPRDNITREQMSLILYKFAQFKGYDTSAKADLNSFHDGSTVSPWALDAVKWAVASQILSGKGDGILDPSGPATRAETTSILMRLIISQED